MSRTFKHKLNGKFNNGLIELKDMPMFMLHYWNRMNFWTGHYRHIRKESIAKAHDLTIEE